MFPSNDEVRVKEVLNFTNLFWKSWGGMAIEEREERAGVHFSFIFFILLSYASACTYTPSWYRCRKLISKLLCLERTFTPQLSACLPVCLLTYNLCDWAEGAGLGIWSQSFDILSLGSQRGVEQLILFSSKQSVYMWEEVGGPCTLLQWTG